MKRIFLSASVPEQGRGNFYETADPFLIQFAVRELLTVCLGRFQIVWGGHPAITPMVWAVCEDLGVEYAKSVKLFQTKFFEDRFPIENERFGNVIYVAAFKGDREKSLLKMRKRMLKGRFEAAVFIGGMEGVVAEYEIFRSLHPDTMVLPVSTPGGAAAQLQGILSNDIGRIDFARLFAERLKIDNESSRRYINRAFNRFNE